MLKAIKARIYPNNEQEIYINRLLGCCRLVYNKALNYKIENYEKDKTNISFSDLGKFVTSLKKQEEMFFLKESHSKVLQQSIIDLNNAFTNFFKRPEVGFPNFKTKKDYNPSCRFPKDAVSGINGNRINIITVLKDIHFKCSVRDEKYLNKNQENIRSITLTKTKTNEYAISILIDKPERENKKLSNKPINNIIGIDLGIKDFIITSEGEVFENIKLTKKYEKKIKRLNRQLSNKTLEGTGKYKFSYYWNKEVEIKELSKNGQKKRKQLAKAYEDITNIKLNYIHEVVNKLLSENQVIVMEDLNVSGMMKNHKLAKAIQDVSWGTFKQILLYKAQWYGRDVIFIDRFFPSSKKCSECGYIKKDLTLSDREWTCPHCGKHHDRDVNAAINIKNEGLRILEEERNKIGLSSPELTLADYPLTGSDDGSCYQSSYDRKKQETKCVLKT